MTIARFLSIPLVLLGLLLHTGCQTTQVSNTPKKGRFGHYQKTNDAFSNPSGVGGRIPGQPYLANVPELQAPPELLGGTEVLQQDPSADPNQGAATANNTTVSGGSAPSPGTTEKKVENQFTPDPKNFLPNGKPNPKGDFPRGIPVPNRPGHIYSPYSRDKGIVDVGDYPSGTLVKDPFQPDQELWFFVR